MNKIWNNITWFFRKVKRVWDFLPHIWRGYDFDYRYAIDLFIYQLERQAKFMESNRAYSSTRLREAERIRTATRLLRKVYDDEYSMEVFLRVQFTSRVQVTPSVLVIFDPSQSEETDPVAVFGLRCRALF